MQTPKAFFDYCVEESCFTARNYETVIKILYDFGYRTIAINQTVVEEETGEPKKKKKKRQPRETADVVPNPFEIRKIKEYEDLTILNRLTISFSNGDTMHTMTKSPNYKKYNIIALLPTSYDALMYASNCTDADIITFDPENKLPIRIPRKKYYQLVENGYFFEIKYAPAIMDSGKRKNTIHVSHLYHSVGKSKNIIISSGATNSFLIRNPYDIINLGLIFGLNEQQSKNSITHCGQQLFSKSVGRNHGKSVMFVEKMKSINLEASVCIIDSDEDMDTDQPAQKKTKI